MLSRAVARRSEMAVRVALGADTGRLVSQMIAESMVLAAAGGVLGLIAAPAAMNLLAGLIPPMFPSAPAARLNLTVLGFTIVLSLLTGIVFSIVPAIHAARASLNDALQQGGRSGSGGRTFTRDVLVVAQVAAALVLLVGAGLMIRTLANLQAADLGFRPAGLLTMRTTLPNAKYPDETARLAFYNAVLQRVDALPGVESAAYASMLPLVTVINETFARMYWPNESPLGARIRFGGAAAPWRTVIGVIKDVRERGFDQTSKPGAYVVYSQLGNAWIPDLLVIRAGQSGR
jgi:hypothetical protein